jgi:hypothetical protein
MAHRASYAFLLSSHNFLGRIHAAMHSHLQLCRGWNHFGLGVMIAIIEFSMTMYSMGLFHPKGKVLELEKDNLMMLIYCQMFHGLYVLNYMQYMLDMRNSYFQVLMYLLVKCCLTNLFVQTIFLIFSHQDIHAERCWVL